MRCRRCGHDNDPAANYCSSCGTPLTADDQTTLSLATWEDRDALDEELGGQLGALPAGLAMLVVRRGPNRGSTFVIGADRVTVGRHPESDIFLDDVTVSRHHAVVEHTPEGYTLRDTGSLNGTYIGHDRIDAALLQDLDEVQIGRFVLTFVLGGPAPAAGEERS
jgi:pSer/pThr/pTyr-binding forkhead associated (FHA) protein